LLFSSCWDRQELESEPSCRFAETHFSSLVRLFIVTVEDGFCVRFLSRQDVIENPGDFMCGGGNRLSGAELGSQACLLSFPLTLTKVRQDTFGQVLRGVFNLDKNELSYSDQEKESWRRF
jgi:hypothetical protein